MIHGNTIHCDQPDCKSRTGIAVSGEAREYTIVKQPGDNNYDTTDATTTEWLMLSLNSGVYDFLKRPEEDVYTEEDGEPI